MSTLHGSLETIALPHVLRLIAASGKTGLLRIDKGTPDGRIFLIDGHISFVTTRNEDDPVEEILHMQYLLDEEGPNRDRRVVDLGELLETNPESFGRFLEQMTIEVLSRFLRSPRGEFRFEEDVRTGRELPTKFPVEGILEKSEVRAAEWEKILEVIPSTQARFRIAPRLDDESDVLLGKRDWTLLAATGSSTSIIEVARHLKIFEFAAAKKAAELLRRGLIEFLPMSDAGSTVATPPRISDMPPLDDSERRPVARHVPEVELESDRSSEDGRDEMAEVAGDEVAAGEPDASPPATPPTAPPRWVAVGGGGRGGGGDERPGAVLLDELHLLQTDDESPVFGKADDEATLPDPPEEPDLPPDATQSRPEPERPAVVATDEQGDDETSGTDLATRWKALRKAKRGAHAAGE